MGRPSKLKVLIASLANFSIGWICLLVSWATFASAVSDKAACIVMDVSKTGVVTATGNFGDIINGVGSYSYLFVILSWLLVTFVIGVLTQKVYTEVFKMPQPECEATPQSEEKADASPQPEQVGSDMI